MKSNSFRYIFRPQTNSEPPHFTPLSLCSGNDIDPSKVNFYFNRINQLVRRLKTGLTEVCSTICVTIKSRAAKDCYKRCSKYGTSIMEGAKLGSWRLRLTISSIDLRTPSVLTIHSIPFCSTLCSLTLIPIIIGDTASIIQYDLQYDF